MIRTLALGLVLLILATVAAAQGTSQPAALVADSVFVEPDGRITARGNVEVFQDGTRLTANSVTYDRATDTLTVDGPITITERDGTFFAADAASLSPGLRAGLLRSARLVLDQQLQLAATEVARVSPRYSTLERVVASSCQVCETNATPLWEIRARRVIQDNLGRQLYFEGAQFRVAGIPLLYLPRLRLPDPSLERATGVLIPQLRTSSSLGTGVKIPYFIPLGAHADVTLTPYLSSSTQTLELRYRQELRLGQIQMLGAISNDDIEGSRGYLFVDANTQLPRDFRAELDLQLVSDPGYLFLYDYSELDRLQNQLTFSRVRDKDIFRSEITEFRTLRDAEIPIRDTLPDRYIDLTYQRTLDGLLFGGQTIARVDAAALNRPSSLDVLGRDVSRIGFGLDWSRTAVLSPGLVVRSELGMRSDAFNIGQDSNFARNVTRFVPRAAVELRWPFARRVGTAQEVIEPVARIDISDVRGQAVPLDESRVVEFDEANLFAPSRFPGVDAAEDGIRVALGGSWRRLLDSGWTSDVTFGRVTNLDGDLGFADGTGLEGDQSEWLLAGRLTLGTQFGATSRALFDDQFTFTLSETRLDWSLPQGRLSTSYIRAAAEPAEGRNTRLSEWSFDGSIALNENWIASGDVRYDFTSGRAARTGLGLGYRNECVAVDFSLSRRFATSSSVTPTTDFGFRVSLLGVGNGGDAGAAHRACRG